MFIRIVVGDNERVLIARNKRFAQILGPGEYWVFAPLRNVTQERFNVRDLVFASEWADFIVKERPDVAAEYFTVIETSDAQVAVIAVERKVARVIAPGKRVLFWRGVLDVTFDLIDVREAPEVPALLVPALARLGREGGITAALVDEGKRGLLYIDGKLVRELGAGTYAFWNVLGTPRVDVIETRRQTVEVPGQEILTKDKVTIRVNISAVYEVVDAVMARSGAKDVSELLYRTLQIAVRQTLGTRLLEEILAEKVDIDASVSAEVRREMAVYRSASRFDRNQGHHSARRYPRDSQPGGDGGEAGAGQPDPPARGKRGHAFLAQHGETDGGEPSAGAPEGAGDAGEGRRQGGEDHCGRRIEFVAGEDGDDSVVNTGQAIEKVACLLLGKCGSTFGPFAGGPLGRDEAP